MVRSLDQFNQDAFTTERKLLIAFGMNKTYVVTRSTLTNTAGREAHALARQKINCYLQVVDPETNVVERRFIDTRLFRRVERLHDVNLDGMRTVPHFENIFVDVFAFAAEFRLWRQTKYINPQFAQPGLISTADRDLLNSEYFEGA